MPIVQVNLMQGRSPEKIEAMITAVSEAVARSLDAPLSSVRIMVREMQPHQYGIGGRPYTQVQAERMADTVAEAEESPT